jgi:Protein of unknown function (DUF2589)
VPGVSLHDLIEALANSVTAAQDRVERFQIANLSRYFDENQRPVRVEVRVPSLRPSAEPGDEDVLSVPLLALIGSVRLGIREVDISMEVDLGDLNSLDTKGSGEATATARETSKQSATSDGGWGAAPLCKGVSVDVHSPHSKDQPAMAKVTLKVQSSEPTEGLARLLLMLNQRISPIGGDGAGGAERNGEKK